MYNPFIIGTYKIWHIHSFLIGTDWRWGILLREMFLFLKLNFVLINDSVSWANGTSLIDIYTPVYIQLSIILIISLVHHNWRLQCMTSGPKKVRVKPQLFIQNRFEDHQFQMREKVARTSDSLPWDYISLVFQSVLGITN